MLEGTCQVKGTEVYGLGGGGGEAGGRGDQKASKGFKRPAKRRGPQDARTRNEKYRWFFPSFYPGRARKAPRKPPKGPKSHQKV